MPCFHRKSVDALIALTLTAAAMVAAAATPESSGSERTSAGPAQQAEPAPPPSFPDVSVMNPRPPTSDELGGDSLYQFILHHATAHYPTSVSVRGSLARWRGGRSETICPRTSGLSPAYDAFVTARIRTLAQNVGAPVDLSAACKDNVRILFTTDPKTLMRRVLSWADSSLGVHYPHQETKLLMQSGAHAIQGWYLTAGGAVLNADATLLGSLDLVPIWPLVIPTSLHGGGRDYSGIIGVLIIVDTAKIAGATIGSIADYAGTLALSVVQSPDHCDALPSILDLMSPTCGGRERPIGVTAGDLAFLRALYYHNTGLGPSLSRDDIQLNMMRQFSGS